MQTSKVVKLFNAMDISTKITYIQNATSVVKLIANNAKKKLIKVYVKSI